MNNYQTWQNWCQIGIAVFGFLGLLSTYGTYYFGNKKDEVLRNQTKDTIKIKDVLKDSNNIKAGKKSKVSQDVVKQNVTINAPNSLITTQNQSGGMNTINYTGEKFNPANVSLKPILDENGNYGVNILNQNVTQISKDIAYSFAAKIPVNTIMKVTLSKISEDKRPLWGMRLGTAKNWIYTT
ncbi:MAG: hypothetical protein RIQ89_1872, partial [Bacteroidota bacterium]